MSDILCAGPAGETDPRQGLSTPAEEEMALVDDVDRVAARRDLAAAGVHALGDFWDGETDAIWQTFRPATYGAPRRTILLTT